MLLYRATHPGSPPQEKGKFFVYDLKKRKLKLEVDDGPKRAIALSRSTGRVYYTRASDDKLMRYDPSREGKPVAISGEIGIRAASAETKNGIIYTVSQGRKGEGSTLYALDVEKEKVTKMRPAAGGNEENI